MQTIAIIGAGYTGTLTAVHLLRSGTPLRVVLFERRSEFGRGVAYSTRCPAHVLNVPAGRMSAFEGDANHFLRWARQQDPSIQGGTFVPRELYGAYLEWILNSEVGGSASARIERIAADVTSLTARPQAPGATVEYRSSGGTGRIEADRVVLALGNFAPANPSGIDARIAKSAGYIADPWDAACIRAIGPNDSVLIVGTGLTMTDLVLQLRGQGHRGQLHALSRRGLLPQPHRSPAKVHHPEPPADIASWPATALGVFKALRREVEAAEGQGIDWREVVTSLRADTARLWNSLGIKEQRRFLMHLRSFWDNHRHRSAPQAAQIIEELVASGTLTVWAGRLRCAASSNGEIELGIQRRGTDAVQSLRVKRIINCTGPETDLSQTDDPLVKSLRLQGFIRPDPLGLGLDATDEGAVLDRSGNPSTWLYCAGGLRRPQLWETTAIPELRIQTAALAAVIASHISAPTIRPAARC